MQNKETIINVSANDNGQEKVRLNDSHVGRMALAQYAPEQETVAEVNSQKKAESFIRRYGQLFSAFARDGSLNFAPSAMAQTFAFYPEEYKIEAPVSWFANPEYTEDELQFANYHELAHFIDMRKNPKAYLENFQKMEEDAKNLAKRYHVSHPETQEGAVEKFYQGELHDLYNVLDDIYVNNVIFDRNHYFDKGDGKTAVDNLYAEKLGFGDSNQTELPLHRQMIMSLLRDEMLSNTREKTIVDERVKETLNKKKLGKSIYEIIDTELKPRRGVLVNPETRYEIIRKLIQPEYLKLLDIALERQEQEQERGQGASDGDKQGKEQGHNSNGDGQGREQGQDVNQSGENNSADTVSGQARETDNANADSKSFDPFNDRSDNGQKPNYRDFLDKGEDSEQTIKDILESFEEADNIEKMSSGERNQYLADKARQDFDKEHGVSPEQRAENEKVKNRIKSARREMRKFWRNLIGKSIEYRRKIIHNQKKGRPNINNYVRRYVEMEEARRNGSLRELDIYDRVGLEREVVDQPEIIDVTLLVDCSGSMGSGKIQAAKDAAALLMYSIKDFNDELDASRRETHSKLRADTQVIAFGSDFEEIKSFRRNQTKSDNEAEIIKSFAEINGGRGGTDDASPLSFINSGLTAEEKAKIKSGKLKKIVFEITDGKPNKPEDTKSQVNRLADEGVLMVGFQIGNVASDERATFDGIWGDSGKNVNGIFIGQDVNKLPSSLMLALSESLNNIVI